MTSKYCKKRPFSYPLYRPVIRQDHLESISKWDIKIFPCFGCRNKKIKLSKRNGTKNKEKKQKNPLGYDNWYYVESILYKLSFHNISFKL